jgi:cell division septation protein DedD
MAILLPGSIAGTTAMLPEEADMRQLEGMLPIQDGSPLDPFVDSDLLAAVPVGPGNVADPVRAVLSSMRVIDTLGESGIPSVAVDAYTRGADRLAVEDPSCGIRWTLLAAIGRVESNHGRFGGAMLRDDGYSTKPIRGIPLDGRPNVALIRDTDDGELDGDTAYDRAVGPMQFIPSTWRSVGVDGNRDGRRDPDNIFDAAYGAARYLCDGDADLRNIGARAQAIRRYNNADEYVRVVLNLAEMYDTGRVQQLPSIGLPPREPTPPPPPSPGPPPAPSTVPAAPSSAPAQPSPRPQAPAPPAPNQPAPAPATPSPLGPRPTTTTTTAPATTAPPAPTTTTSTPAPPATTSTTAPPAPTTSSTTLPTTTTTTVPEEPPAEEPVAPEEPTAAVGWAPAMREVVVEILEDAPGPARAAPDAPAPTTPEAAAPPAPAEPAPADCPTAAPAPDAVAGCPPAGAPTASPPATEPPKAAP